ncbi:MAG: hypothetical protein DHS20C01_37160 [marine bacterium B5-7]|nr:MAG: hypothetical protein DHS20C01_37160 [marine bacterium B5-7]
MESTGEITTSVLTLFKACAAFLVTAVGILFCTDDDEAKTAPIRNGSDRFGEHNFRTDRLHASSDADEWYEEDP